MAAGDRKVLTAPAVPCLCPGCGGAVRQRRTGRSACRFCGLEMDLWVAAPAVRRASREDLVSSLPEAASETKPPCSGHPGNASVTACGRCGDFICEVCRIHVEGTDLCPRCFEHRVDRAELMTLQRRFRLPSMALGLGIFSIFGGFLFSFFASLFGLFAMGVGVKALLDIRRRPALEGKGKAIAGVVCGLIGTLVWAAVFIAIFVTGTLK